MSISAMKQALEALEVLLRDYGAVHDAGDLEMQPAFHQAHVAVEKLRQAIAEAEKQEPVAWYLPSDEGFDSFFRDHRTVVGCTGNKWEGWQPLYTAPLKREWVGLTTDERDALVQRADQLLDHIYEYGTASEGIRPRLKSLFTAVEAKLKEKNT